jgi:hypothetical protein
VGKASGLYADITARLCNASHLGIDAERKHVDLRIKLRRADSGPAIQVLDVGIDGPQALSAVNHFDPVTVDFGGLPRGVFLELASTSGEPLRVRAGDWLTVRLRLSTGITAVSEVSVVA